MRSVWVWLLVLTLAGCDRSVEPEATRSSRGDTATFLENRGQWPTTTRFAASFPDLSLQVEARALRLALPAGRDRSVVVRLAFEGARAARLVGEQQTSGVHHFVRDGGAAVSTIGWRAVRMTGLYEDVDVRLRTHDGRLEYDLLLAAGARLDRVRVRCDGVQRLRLDGDDLCLETALGVLRQPPPKTWAVACDGRRVPVTCRYELLGEKSFGFRAPGWSGDVPLVVDPGLIWSTYIGGKLEDGGYSSDFDAQGNLLIAGHTMSLDFPTTPGAYDRTFNGGINRPWRIGDLFVAKFAGANGKLLWATYLGGKENDHMSQMRVVRKSGEAVLTGWTTSTDFPTTAGAYDRTFNGVGQGYLWGGGDIFITRVKADGSGLVYSTFLGGSDLEYALAIAIGKDESVAVTGHVHSTDFPTTPGVYSPKMTGTTDSYVTRLAPDGSRLLASTYWGGTWGEDYGKAIGFGPDGSIYVAGPTDAPDLPTTPNAYDRTFNGGKDHWADGFVLRMDGLLTKRIYATYLGSKDNDFLRGLSVAADGSVVVIGETDSASFPTTRFAFDQTHNGKRDVTITRLNASGSRIEWSTYLGGVADDNGFGVQTDGAGVVVTGITRSLAFPTTAGAMDRSHNGWVDVFVARIDPEARRIDYSTFLGGGGHDAVERLAVAPSGDIGIAGLTWSTDFPVTQGAFQPKNAGRSDAVAARIELLPTGVARFGSGTLGCAGIPTADVSSQPSAGNQAFALTCGRVAPSTGGLFVIGARGLGAPITILGAALWIDPTQPFFLFPVASSARGGAVLPLPLGAWSGLTLVAQSFWLDRCSPGGLSASGALRIRVQ